MSEPDEPISLATLRALEDLAGTRPPRPQIPHIASGIITAADVHDMRTACDEFILTEGLLISGVFDDELALRIETSTLSPEARAERARRRSLNQWEVQSRNAFALSRIRGTLTLVAERHVLAAPVEPPDPAHYEPSRGCATWWTTTNTGDVGTGYTHTCALDGQHRSPHVDLSTGTVRLGHEPDLAHVPHKVIEVAVQSITRILGINIRPSQVAHFADLTTRELWRLHYAKHHDHTTCGWCPRDVWE